EHAVEGLGIAGGRQWRPIVDECIDELLPGRRIVQQDDQIIPSQGGLGLRVKAREIALSEARRGCQGFKNGETALQLAIDVASDRLGNLMDAFLELRAFRLGDPEEKIAA